MSSVCQASTEKVPAFLSTLIKIAIIAVIAALQ
jgi:hypothetical protein